MASAIKCDVCGKYEDGFGLSVNLWIGGEHGEKELCRDCGKKVSEFIEKDLMKKE